MMLTSRLRSLIISVALAMVFISQLNATTVFASANASLSLKDQRAITWVSSQLGSWAWTGRCLPFVQKAFGDEYGYPTPAILSKHLTLSLDWNPPVGSIVLFADGYAGHIGVVVNTKGEMIHASLYRPVEKIRIIDWVNQTGEVYLGASPAPWPGRAA